MTLIHIRIGMFNDTTLGFRINGIAPVKFVCIYCTSICDNI